jgi:DNA-binding CsgD family transcriptional regulator
MMDQAGFRSRVELLLLAFRAGELSDKSQPEHAGVSRLSAREKEVTRLAVFTQQEVAARREISVSTVRAHMHNAMQKADVPHRAGLVAATIRENIITIDEFVLRSDEADSES